MTIGEIYALGKHRLMCGDATKREDVYALIGNDNVNLVLTDPPYGKNYVAHDYCFKSSFRQTINTNTRGKKIYGDNSQESAKKHYELIHGYEKIIIWGGQYFTEFLPHSKGWLVWNKHHTLTNHSACELAYTNLRINNKLYDHTWNGACKKGSHKLNPRPCIHPNQKPVELHMKILEDFSKPDDVILDCFGGSGTTLIACEMTDRKCLMMEISPEYCEVIIRRYEELTGHKAERL